MTEELVATTEIHLSRQKEGCYGHINLRNVSKKGSVWGDGIGTAATRCGSEPSAISCQREHEGGIMSLYQVNKLLRDINRSADLAQRYRDAGY
ncbi:MAG: hypothetical protein K6T59_14870, partial [Bryobacteraceae bacterium]|nr:hypothetical protein [Bryobacteraceae bacterium]